MNRYTTGGIAVDLIDGWKVGIIAPKLEHAREQFLAVLDELPEEILGRTLTATGRERLDVATGGRLTVHAARPSALRGHTLDVLVVLDHREIDLDALRPYIGACLAPNGERILA